MSYENNAVGDLQFYERSPFLYGAGVNAPTGYGGPTLGPFYGGGRRLGPGSCSEVSGGQLVCMGAPYTSRGLQTGRGWPPEVGAQEEYMMEQGCVATGRRCGGSVRAPSQYWCCPGGSRFIGSPFPPTMAGLGTNEASQIDPRFIMSGYMLPAGLVVMGAWVALKIMDSFSKTR